jgi:hypothetical protein
MDTEADNRAYETPSHLAQLTAKGKQFREAGKRLRRAGEDLIVERDRLQELLEATETVDALPDEAAAP